MNYKRMEFTMSKSKEWLAHLKICKNHKWILWYRKD